MSSTHTINQTEASIDHPSSSALHASIELQHVVPAASRDQGRKFNGQGSSSTDPASFLPQPSTTVSVAERWNHPKSNTCRTLAILFAFIVMGANDAAYGAIIPYLEEYYDLTYAVVSLIFLSPMSGYISAALLNNWLHVRFGQRGIAFLGPACHLVAYLGIALHPPYPVLVVLFIFSGFGNGIEDAAWNAWAGSLANANEVLGFLHGLYGLGALLSPLAATSLIAKRGWQWYQFYHIMLGGACIELATSLWAFRSSSAQVYCQKSLHANAEGEGRLKQALSSRVTWIAAIFLFGYVGAGGALGGWIVTFMRRERAGGEFESGIVATGFWTGIATGRLVLSFITPKLGEKLAVLVYIIVAIICQLMFWLIPSFYASAIFIAL